MGHTGIGHNVVFEVEVELAFFANDELGKVHIPGCAGAAVYGPASCTCVRDDSLRERLRIAFQRIERAERYGDWARDQLISAGLPFAPMIRETVADKKERDQNIGN